MIPLYRFVSLKLTLSVSFVNLELFYRFRNVGGWVAIGWKSFLQNFFKDCPPWRNCKYKFCDISSRNFSQWGHLFLVHCVSIRSIAFKSFKTWFWNLSLSIESVDYGVWSVVPLCRSSSKRDCSNLYEIGTWCFDNVNEGSDYTPLQSCLSVERSTGSLGVIGNAKLFWLRVLWGDGEGSEGGGREGEEGEIKSPQVKKKEETFRAVDFYLFPLSH